MTKKSFVLMAAAAMTTAAVAIGGTLAYLHGTADLMNTFSMGGEDGSGEFTILLSETEIGDNGETVGGVPTWSLNRVADRNTTGIEYLGVQPGAHLPKEPTVQNTGDFPMWVRMQTTLENANQWATALEIDLTATGGPEALAAAVLTGTPDDFIVIADYDEEADELTVSYLYEGVLGTEGNEDNLPTMTPAAFTNVVVPTAFETEDLATVSTFSLPVVAHAIQTYAVYENEDGSGSLVDGYNNVVDAMKTYEAEVEEEEVVE